MNSEIEKKYTEEELVELVQSGEFTMLDYVMNTPLGYRDQFIAYCRNNGLSLDQDSAIDFLSKIENEAGL